MTNFPEHRENHIAFGIGSKDKKFSNYKTIFIQKVSATGFKSSK